MQAVHMSTDQVLTTLAKAAVSHSHRADFVLGR